MEVVFIWLVLAVIIAVAASQRGRSGVGWFLLAALLSPLVAALLLLLFPSRRDPLDARYMIGDFDRQRAIDDRELQRAIKRSRQRADC